MRVLLSTYESHRDVELMVGLAVAAEECDALAAGGMMPALVRL
ncbi:MAG TPA: hypothetical protein VFI90_10185 [Rubrobacter sp.]|nr:hypothetical protein [Rubrobacter sp.]